MKFTISDLWESALLKVMPRRSHISRDASDASFYGEKACERLEKVQQSVDNISESLDKLERMMIGNLKLSIATAIMILIDILLILVIR